MKIGTASSGGLDSFSTLKKFCLLISVTFPSFPTAIASLCELGMKDIRRLFGDFIASKVTEWCHETARRIHVELEGKQVGNVYQFYVGEMDKRVGNVGKGFEK